MTCIFVNMQKAFAAWFLVLMLSGSAGMAQDNTIVNEQMIWSNLREVCEPGGNTYTTFYHRFEGDTMVEGKTYKKVFISLDEGARLWSFTDELVREEAGRVYLRDQDGVEGLLYDFNLRPGEEVTVTNPLEPDGLTLLMTGIDSVETANGYRKRWTLVLDEYAAPEYWIEGIGSASGVLNSGTGVFLGICGIYYLLCASEDGNTIYMDPDYQTCYYTLLDDGNHISGEQPATFVTYQPSTKTMVITGESLDGTEFMLNSISGNVVMRATITNGSNRIDCSGIPPGFYVVTVMENNRVKSAKLSLY
jgi:hypothetical protein